MKAVLRLVLVTAGLYFLQIFAEQELEKYNPKQIVGQWNSQCEIDRKTGYYFKTILSLTMSGVMSESINFYSDWWCSDHLKTLAYKGSYQIFKDAHSYSFRIERKDENGIIDGTTTFSFYDANSITWSKSDLSARLYYNSGKFLIFDSLLRTALFKSPQDNIVSTVSTLFITVPVGMLISTLIYKVIGITFSSRTASPINVPVPMSCCGN